MSQLRKTLVKGVFLFTHTVIGTRLCGNNEGYTFSGESLIGGSPFLFLKIMSGGQSYEAIYSAAFT